MGVKQVCLSCDTQFQDTSVILQKPNNAVLVL